MHPSLPLPNEIDRRRFLSLAGGAFGLLPLASLQAEEDGMSQKPEQEKPAKISRVVFFFMNGGPSQIDTFDPKPALKKYDGTNYTGKQKIGSANRKVGTLWPSEFEFTPRGESGLEISELFPELGRFADDLCLIRSMQTESSLHAPALLTMNTGRPRLGAASLGAWVDYGLGAINENLPHFAVMLDPRGGPIGRHGNWSPGPLPVSSPTVIHSPDHPILNLSRKRRLPQSRERQMQDLFRTLNQHQGEGNRSTRQRKQRQRAYELAWKMQSAAPEATDLSQETQQTQTRYGLDAPPTREFGKRCLLARRLLERGVRFVQIYSGGGKQKNTWDSHVGNVARHRRFAGETDQPIASFLEDLKQTGLWKETLVIWGGEFGRTPTREQNSQGRDHNPHGFTMWLAGGAIRGGHVVGATDEVGFEAVESICDVADLHATILHLLGLDPETLKFYQNGVEVGLTGPQPCRILTEVLA